MVSRSLLLLCAGLLIGIGPATAQSENIKTVKGPGRGAETTLTATPHSLGEGLSARALGISRPDTTRWALQLLGAEGNDPIHAIAGTDTLHILHVERPDEGDIGPTTVYVRRDDFLAMAELGTVTLTVGDVRASLPQAFRREIRVIFDRVTG